jgi:hypothetical protein
MVIGIKYRFSQNNRPDPYDHTFQTVLLRRPGKGRYVECKDSENG